MDLMIAQKWFPLAFTLLLACGGAGAEDDGSSSSSGQGAGMATGGSGGTGANGGGGNGGSGAGSGGGVGNGNCTYPGIPHPTDMLPGGIMPTLPTPNVQAGFPYDPCSIEVPSVDAAGNLYVVATDGDDATAGNSGQGTVEAPRASMPTGTFGPGTVVYIYGANSPYGTVDFNIGDDEDFTFDCNADEPCFLVGVDTPRIGRRFNISDSSHLIIDGLSVVDTPGGSRPFGSIRFMNSDYLTLRNSEVRGNGSNSSGGSVVSMSGVQFMVTFQTQIHTAGTWQSNATGVDVHGWRPGYDNRYLWLLDSELYHLQADGVQTGNSSNNNPQASSSHYVFIGGNTFYENYENALDNKNSYHVMFSSNEVRDHYAASDASPSNGTAVILSNNAEGPWTSHHWAINNRIHDAGLGIRDSGSEDDELNFMVGNVIWNVNTGLLQANNAANRELWVVNNSVHGSMVAFDIFQPGSNASAFVRGNVFHSAGTMDTQSSVNSVMVDNVLFGTTLEGSWDQETGTLTLDPMLADPGSGDMTPASGSPAVDATEEDAVYALFESLYGQDIRVDLLGTARPASGWDIGAVELP
jgi:hypothetical protein